MKQQIIARRYATALLQEMADEEQARRCQEELGLAQEVFDSYQVRYALEYPAFSPVAQEQVLGDLIERMGLEERLGRFLRALFAAGRIAEISAVAVAFGQLLEERFEVHRAEVRTAGPLGDELCGKLQERLEEFIGGRVEIDVVEDPELLAGWRTRVGNYLIEADLRSRAERIRERVVKG